VVVVPVPIGRDPPATRAGAHLRESIRKVNDGDYDDVVTNARKGIESYGGGCGVVGERSSRSRVVHAASSSARAVLRHTLFSLLSPAAHSDPMADQLTWDRASALAVMATGAGTHRDQ
jgi:hypothetical protein